MEDKEIQELIKEHRDEIAKRNDLIYQLHEELKKNSPIQIGDRVRVTTPEHIDRGWKREVLVPESSKEAGCVDLEINDWAYDDEVVQPVYHPITRAGVVAKVGRFKAGKTDKVEKI